MTKHDKPCRQRYLWDENIRRNLIDYVTLGARHFSRHDAIGTD